MKRSLQIRGSSGSTVRSGRWSRMVDFHVGRIILWIIGSLRSRPRSDVTQPIQIGLCVLGAIGDALLASALITDLKQHYPGARVIMVVSKTNENIVRMLQGCDAYIVVPVFSPWRSIPMLRAQRFNLLIDANQWLRISALNCAFSGARHTIGFRTPGQYRHYAFDSWAEHQGTRHEIENYRALLATLGIVGTAVPKLETTKSDEATVRDLVATPYVVLHPWAGGGQAALKEWPIGHWIKLAQALAARGYAIVVTGAPVDVHKTELLAEAAGRSSVPVIVMAGRLNLGQTGCLLKLAALVISVNTGVMHMAAALGVPTVALHGPTNPARWGPISQNAVSVVPSPVPPGVSVGYLNLGFEFPRDAPACMNFISVEAVLNAVDAVLGDELSFVPDGAAERMYLA